MVGEGDIPSIEGLLGLEAIIGVEEDGLNIAFNLGLYQPPGKEDSFEVAVIGLQGRRILAALPGTAWHRKLDRRVLPPGTITRPLFVRVAGCGEEDRFEILAGCLVDVWIGWLGEDVWSKLVFDPSQTGTHRFLDTNSGAACFPFAEALSKVVQEKFNFVTPVHDVGDERLAALESRFSSLEGSIQQLLALQQGGGGSGYATAAEHLSSGSAAPGVTRPRLGARPKAEVSAPPPGLDDHMELAGLDPATVASALQAGIPRSQLLVMGKLLREKPKIGEVPQAPRLATFDQDELSETDDIFPAQALEETKEAAQDPVSEALVKLTSIVGKLSNRGGDDLLDGGGSGSADTSLQQSRRHTAVLTALKKALSKEPPEDLESDRTEYGRTVQSEHQPPQHVWPCIHGAGMGRTQIKDIELSPICAVHLGRCRSSRCLTGKQARRSSCSTGSLFGPDGTRSTGPWISSPEPGVQLRTTSAVLKFPNTSIARGHRDAVHQTPASHLGGSLCAQIERGTSTCGKNWAREGSPAFQLRLFRKLRQRLAEKGAASERVASKREARAHSPSSS